jgi:hypothetical protein
MRVELNELKEGKTMAKVAPGESEYGTHKSIFLSGANKGKQEGGTCLESTLQLER